MTRCGICYHYHNHFHCPTCGAVKVGDNFYNALTGREMVKAYGVVKRALIDYDTPATRVLTIAHRLVARANTTHTN